MSITIAQADVTNVAPELASESSTRVNLFISIAAGYVDEGTWGTTKANQAVQLLAAHLITVANRGAKSQGAGGSITEVKVGDLQTSFSPENATSDLELSTTNYGKLYLSLRRTIALTPLII